MRKSLRGCRLNFGSPRIIQGYEAQIVAEILKVAEQEIENNPTQLLTLDRGKAAALIDGAVYRSEVYQRAQAKVYELIDKAAPRPPTHAEHARASLCPQLRPLTPATPAAMSATAFKLTTLVIRSLGTAPPPCAAAAA